LREEKTYFGTVSAETAARSALRGFTASVVGTVVALFVVRTSIACRVSSMAGFCP
jgi:spore maturation protein SpmB